MKLTKMHLIIVLISSLMFTSCANDDLNLSIEEKIIGKWNLTQILTVGQNGPNSIDFQNLSNSNVFIVINNDISVTKNFEIHNQGNYNFAIKLENYFVPANNEAKNNIIEFDNKRYMIEIGENNGNRILKLTSYKGIEKQLYFEEKK